MGINMSYIEDQRKRAVSQRDRIFRDPGNGVYRSREREFVLKDPRLNLWAGIREDAINYFKRNNIVWWSGSDIPPGHLLSSQIACVNHMFPLRQRADLALNFLNHLSSDFIDVAILDDGFVEFEVNGAENYLNERSHQRGANSTSIDAVMVGIKSDRSRVLVGIEWKYTESYPSESKYVAQRYERYNPLLMKQISPIETTEPEALYFEPYYQLMRQALLLAGMVEIKEYGCSSFLHLHVVPEENKELCNTNPSPGLEGDDMSMAWKSVLKDTAQYQILSPEVLFAGIKKCTDSIALHDYLNNRYW